MAKSVTVKVEGLSDLGKRMKGLSEDMNNKIARSATAAAATVIMKAAKANVAVDTGNLKKNIIVKRIRPSETSLTSEHITTVRKGRVTKKQAASGLGDAWYGRLVEYGTVKMAAQPFIRPAYDQNKEKAVEAMKNRISQRLTKVGA